MTRLRSIVDCLDPRGRCDRRGLLVAALVLLSIEAAGFLGYTFGWLHRSTPMLRAAELLLAWIGIAITIKRLHDCRISAAWLAAAFVVVMGWCFILTLGVVLVAGPVAMSPDSDLFTWVLVLSAAPMMAGAIWLHLVKGDPIANTYGPVPNRSGFSHPRDARPAAQAEAPSQNRPDIPSPDLSPA